MALTDIFTGGATRRATQQGQQFLQNQLGDLRGLLYGGMERGIGELRSGEYEGQNILEQFLPQATGEIRSSADLARRILQGSVGNVQGAIEGKGIPKSLEQLFAGLGGAEEAFGRGEGALRGGLAGAEGALDPAIARSSRGADLYADVMGLNGPEGAARGSAAFKAGPAYEFNLGQGLEAINRRRAAGGMLSGGNADREAQEFGSGLASKEFGDWRSGLERYNPLEANLRSTLGGFRSSAGTNIGNLLATLGGLRSSTGRAGADIVGSGYNRLADFYGGLGKDTASLETGAGRNISDIFSKFGMAGSAIPQDAAARIANLISTTGGQYTGASVGLSKAITDLLTTGGKATDQGTKNLFDLIGNLVRSGISGAGGGMSGVGGSMTDFARMSPGGFGGF